MESGEPGELLSRAQRPMVRVCIPPNENPAMALEPLSFLTGYFDTMNGRRSFICPPPNAY